MLPRQKKVNAGRFELLELRLALAGNVTAALFSGGLLITGDNSANGILVEQIDADSFRVTGLGTRVNGSFSPQRIDGVVNGIGLDMRGGNDVVTLKNLTVPGEGLGVLLGDGNDVLLMTGVTVLGACGIDGGSGSDAITIDKCTFDYNLGVETRSDNDALAISRSTVFGGLSIQMDEGNDTLSMLNDKVLQPTLPSLEDGIEIPENFQILREAFFDIECGAIITTGSGNDAVALNGVQIDCLTQIDTGDGSDSVAIANSRFGQILQLDDSLDEWTPTTDSTGLCIETGLGNDAVTIASTKAYGHLQIDTSDEVPCQFEITPSQETESTKDGNDSVVLNKVDVLTAVPLLTPETVTPELLGPECGSLSIYTGNGSDAVVLNAVNTDCEAFIQTTDLADSSLDSGDSVAIANSSFNRLDFVVIVGGGEVYEESTGLFVFTGRGNDVVSIASVHVNGAARIETGDGTDKVAVNALVADEIFVELGDGNYDTLSIANSSANFASFDGGGGIGDSLVRAHNHFIAQVISGFEFVV
jgi:hypothetical protein